MASSKTAFNPFWVKALHSKYFTAPISFTIDSACSTEMGAIFLSCKRAKVSGSSLKSILVPTRSFGVLGQWWAISGFHYKRKTTTEFLKPTKYLSEPFRRTTYLSTSVFVRRRRDNRKADKKDVRLGVTQGSQSVVIFLASCVPQSQVDCFVIHHHVCTVVIKYFLKSKINWFFSTPEGLSYQLGCIPQGKRL